jgi:hypothetical protein
MVAASDRRAANCKSFEYAVTFKAGSELGLAFKDINGACVVVELEPDSKVILGSLVNGGYISSFSMNNCASVE